MNNFKSILEGKFLGQLTLGEYIFKLDFKSDGYWITDARGRRVCECTSDRVAKDIVEILNGDYKPFER